MIWLFEKHEQFRKSQDFIISLALGLADPDEEIQSIVYQFWNVNHLSKSPKERLNQLMTSLYHPKVETSWLSFSTRLLLEISSQSTDFEKQLFSPLENCVYKVLLQLFLINTLRIIK